MKRILPVILCGVLGACTAAKQEAMPNDQEQAMRIAILEQDLMRVQNELIRMRGVSPQPASTQGQQVSAEQAKPVAQAVPNTAPAPTVSAKNKTPLPVPVGKTAEKAKSAQASSNMQVAPSPQVPQNMQATRVGADPNLPKNAQNPVIPNNTPVNSGQMQVAQPVPPTAPATYETKSGEKIEVKPLNAPQNIATQQVPANAANNAPANNSISRVTTPPPSYTNPINVIPEPLLVLSTTPQSNSKTSAKSSTQSIYEQGLNALYARNYKTANANFDKYLQMYPKGKYVPNILYWKGEILYSQAKYPEAIMQFKDEITRFPKHAKTADSLLKIAMCYRNIGDKENATLHLRILIEDFPKSEAAKKAKVMGLVQ